MRAKSLNTQNVSLSNFFEMCFDMQVGHKICTWTQKRAQKPGAYCGVGEYF